MPSLPNRLSTHKPPVTTQLPSLSAHDNDVPQKTAKTTKGRHYITNILKPNHIMHLRNSSTPTHRPLSNYQITSTTPIKRMLVYCSTGAALGLFAGPIGAIIGTVVGALVARFTENIKDKALPSPPKIVNETAQFLKTNASLAHLNLHELQTEKQKLQHEIQYLNTIISNLEFQLKDLHATSSSQTRTLANTWQKLQQQTHARLHSLQQAETFLQNQFTSSEQWTFIEAQWHANTDAHAPLPHNLEALTLKENQITESLQHAQLQLSTVQHAKEIYLKHNTGDEQKLSSPYENDINLYENQVEKLSLQHSLIVTATATIRNFQNNLTLHSGDIQTCKNEWKALVKTLQSLPGISENGWHTTSNFRNHIATLEKKCSALYQQATSMAALQLHQPEKEQELSTLSEQLHATQEELSILKRAYHLLNHQQRLNNAQDSAE